MRILSDEEAFNLMCQRFSRLSPHDVIDICLPSPPRGFPAMVTGVNRQARMFSIIPLTKDNIRSLLEGKRPPEEDVKLTQDPGQPHPTWNVVGDHHHA